MGFDIYKRETKEIRLNRILENSKKKLNEVERCRVFNRLIEDTNRRYEDQDYIDKINNHNKNNQENSSFRRSISQDEWNKIYTERFLSYKLEKDLILKNKMIQKQLEEKNIEEKKVEEVLNNQIKKKLCKEDLKISVDRLYLESKRRERYNHLLKLKEDHEEINDFLFKNNQKKNKIYTKKLSENFKHKDLENFTVNRCTSPNNTNFTPKNFTFYSPQNRMLNNNLTDKGESASNLNNYWNNNKIRKKNFETNKNIKPKINYEKKLICKNNFSFLNDSKIKLSNEDISNSKEENLIYDNMNNENTKKNKNAAYDSQVIKYKEFKNFGSNNHNNVYSIDENFNVNKNLMENSEENKVKSSMGNNCNFNNGNYLKSIKNLKGIKNNISNPNKGNSKFIPEYEVNKLIDNLFFAK